MADLFRELLIDQILDHQKKGWSSGSNIEFLRTIYQEKSDVELEEIGRRTHSDAWQMRDELEKLSTDDLRARYEPIKAELQRAEAERKRAEEAAEWQRVCERWGRKPYWTILESAVLLLRGDPDRIILTAYSPGRFEGRQYIDGPSEDSVENLKDDIKRALKAGKLRPLNNAKHIQNDGCEIPPAQLAQWAERFSIQFPDALRDAVARFHDVPDYKAECESLRRTLAQERQKWGSLDSGDGATKLTLAKDSSRLESPDYPKEKSRISIVEHRAAVIRLLADERQLPKLVPQEVKDELRKYLCEKWNSKPWDFTISTFDRAWKLAKDRIGCVDPAAAARTKKIF